jgi:hypothetical protein
MNWGKGIVTGMIIFMLFILSMCIYMFRMPADEYDHQYYEKGLSFNKDYEREQRVVSAHAAPLINQEGTHLVIKFKTPASGKISLIRPADKASDKAYPLQSGEDNKVFILLNDIKKGQWQVMLEWEHDHKSYLYQQEVYIK